MYTSKVVQLMYTSKVVQLMYTSKVVQLMTYLRNFFTNFMCCLSSRLERYYVLLFDFILQNLSEVKTLYTFSRFYFLLKL